MECPVALRQSFLLRAREAFTIGLLTKAEGELVASKQELHTFLKAAYSLAVTHKWLGAPPETVAEATEACLKALAKFHDYDSDAPTKDALCTEIMRLVARVRDLLGVEPFKNSEPGSFIPDDYRDAEDVSVNFTLEGFARALRRFKQYHASLCEASNKCRGSADGMDGARVCITALGTTVDGLNTACMTEACSAVDSSKAHLHQKSELGTTVGSTDELGSSWQNFSSISGNPGNSTTHAIGSSTSNGRGEKFKVIQAGIETLDTAEDGEPTGARETLESLSQLVLRTSSSSLSGSFGSQSSWQKADLSPSAARKPLSSFNVEMGQRSKSANSDGSFQFLETLDSEGTDSAGDHVARGDFKDSSRLQPLESHHAVSVDSASPKPAPMGAPHPNSPQPVPGQLASTEASTENSFKIIQEGPMELQSSAGASVSEESAPERRNGLCYRCVSGGAAAGVDPERQYSLSQEDYQALLAGVCHDCMLKRFHSETTQFKLQTHRTAHSECEFACSFRLHFHLLKKKRNYFAFRLGGLHLKFSKATGLWTAKETGVYIGETMGLQGKQRAAIWVRFLHQEERLSRCVACIHDGSLRLLFLAFPPISSSFTQPDLRRSFSPFLPVQKRVFPRRWCLFGSGAGFSFKPRRRICVHVHRYVGKDYLRPKEIQFHLKDVERQMTAQHYVTEFNKGLYDKDVMAQIFFIPSEALLVRLKHKRLKLL